MNRAILSQRITSILADLNRLTNALYAMNTTDIQRYPDNYEVLSTDAALRAENIACRLRHLIYSTTSIKKEEYLTSTNGIYVTDSNGQINVQGVTGTIIVTEIETIPGYIIDPNTKSQTVKVNPDDTQYLTFVRFVP